MAEHKIIKYFYAANMTNAPLTFKLKYTFSHCERVNTLEDLCFGKNICLSCLYLHTIHESIKRKLVLYFMHIKEQGTIYFVSIFSIA